MMNYVPIQQEDKLKYTQFVLSEGTGCVTPNY